MLRTAKPLLFALTACLWLTACENPSDRSPPGTGPAPSATTDTSAAAQFAAVRGPTQDEARVYGTYTRGCIAGAHQLTADSPRWQILNPQRNRGWGHPALLRFIDRLATNVAADGHRGLLVGDLAQPRGGPLPSDHNSHQVGLDADIWLTPLPPQRLSGAELESYEPPSMVDVDRLSTNSYFGDAQASMLRRAAESPDVERIFVSPPIKQALCQRTREGDRDWLRKIRPWRGHMSHMHVRLACPTESDDCKDQEPPPEGDGCGSELQSWMNDRSWLKQGTSRYVPERAMKLDGLPAQCRQLLKSQG
jgi:penicillin-insensitive murein DD-endopeptidase